MSRGLRRGRGGAAAAGVGRYTEKERERVPEVGEEDALIRGTDEQVR